MKKIFVSVVAPLAAISLGAFSQVVRPAVGMPSLFAPGIISTQDFEYGLSLSPDGRTALFTRGDAGFNRLTILESHLDNGRWSKPQVASFSGIWKDTDARFSEDGQKIMFISTRPVSGAGEPRKDYDIWFVERQGRGWSEARHLEGPVNSDANEASPTLMRDGTLYFEASRPDHPGTHIYRSRLINGRYGEPELLGFAGKGSDINPAISSDGGFIVFASRDRGGVAGMDLFITFAGPNGTWSDPRNLGEPINSKFNETSPSLSADDRTLYFSSNRIDQPLVRARQASFNTLGQELHGPQNGLLDIYEVPLPEIHNP